jgi:hypothetical protein
VLLSRFGGSLEGRFTLLAQIRKCREGGFEGHVVVRVYKEYQKSDYLLYNLEKFKKRREKRKAKEEREKKSKRGERG